MFVLRTASSGSRLVQGHLKVSSRLFLPKFNATDFRSVVLVRAIVSINIHVVANRTPVPRVPVPCTRYQVCQ
jgi:hypothetical protein